MSDTEAAPASPGPEARPEPFESLAALRLAHQAMLERQAGSDTAPPQDIPRDEVAAYIDRASATGAILDDPEDRRTVQRILDYWSADLVAASRRARAEVRPVQLAPYAPPASGVMADAAGSGDDWVAEGSRAEGGAVQTPEEARQYIRLSALSRQWRDSRAAGYLLTGEALKEAERFARDPDVAALIKASREAETNDQRRLQRIKNALIAALVVVIVALSWLTWQSMRQRDLAEVARQDAVAAREEAVEAQREAEAAQKNTEAILRVVREKAADAQAERKLALESEARATAALEESQRLRAALEETHRATIARLAEQDSRQQLLDSALDLLGRQIREGAIDLGAVPSDELRELLLARGGSGDGPDQRQAYDFDLAQVPPPRPDMVAAGLPMAGDDQQPPTSDDAPTPPATGATPAFVGYDPDFLGLKLPLPELGRGQVQTAWEGGAAIPYFNFSLVLDTQRRMALFSAANLDRVRSRSLPRAPDAFRPDPRLPPAAQPDPAVFEDREIDRGHLVARGDIAWGPGLPEDTAEAAAFVAQVTSLHPNLVPQFAAVNRGSWNAVEDWVRLQHNPGASRVTILAGPVFGTDTSGAAPPVAFWKIAVSTQPGLSKDPANAPLVVDAFVVPNDTSAALAPERYRVTVDEITVRTGLGFPPALAQATRRGERLVARLPELDGSDATTRRSLVQELVDLLRSPTAAADDQRRVCEALLEMATGPALAELSPAGQVNLFYVLAQIPAATWDREPWLPLKAQARRALAGLQAEMGPQARGNLDLLRERLGLADPFPQTVYLQFAGFTREHAVAVGAGLQALGWRVPGEERVESARGVNQVRYHAGDAEDEAAARLLAADLRAAGQPEVAAVAMEVIRPGILEVWISR